MLNQQDQDTVLITYLKSNYPTANIVSILTACSPLTTKVLDSVNTSNLSVGLKTQINSLQTGTSVVTDLFAKAANYFTSRQLLFDVAIRSCLSGDSINYNQAAALMKRKANELPARFQVLTGLATKDSAMGAAALAQVVNQEGQSNFVTINSMLLQNMNATPQQILSNPSTLNQVQTIAGDSSDRLTYTQANILLQAINLSSYMPLYQENSADSSNTNSRREHHKTIAAANSSNTFINTTPSQSSLYNSPNPFKESTMVTAFIVEQTQNAYIVITDIIGNEVARYQAQQGQNNINVSGSSLDQAVMFCTLVVDGVKIKTNKMVLIR